ncbi:uncharacterized protein [Nerophis lumbriciformis]|uniref:uncharacterized protein n=1 Tax=Nerophis lumbriciformis TaxID=546530 RepID=UPI003BAAE88B
MSVVGGQKNPVEPDFHNLAPNSAGPPEDGEDDTLTALAGALSELAATTRQQCQVLRALADQGGGALSVPTTVTIPRMGEKEDPHAFLDIFAATARACAWPEEEWGVRLLPLLTGEAQRAALSLPAPSRVRFEDLRRAVLDRTGGTAEDCRRRFRSMRLGKEDRPFAFGQRLQEAATRWLQPGEGDGRLLDQIVLEQFVEAIPTRTANWIRYHRPRDLAAAVTLAENHLAVHREERERHIPHFFPRDPPSALSPQVPDAASRTSPAQTAPQTLGQACWRRGPPGRARHGPPQVEVGRVSRVAAPSVPSPGPGETYGMKADASGRGLGAVLSQQVEGVDRPILYISRKLSEREARYSTVERECLAIRWAVGALRYYLLGRSFSLCSDHKPLQWLHRMNDANARITRWYLALQPYNFRVIHKPGAQMAVADFLSRSLTGGGSGRGRTASRPESGGGGM